jgi:hypothetical protein
VTVEELLAYVFGDQPSVLAARCAGWARESRRFKEFAETYRDKLRKKARAARDEAALLDLEAEVATAFRLLQARRLSVTWEPQVPGGGRGGGSQASALGGGRGPDFAVDFTTRFRFYVEVTRPRLDSGMPETPPGPPGTPDASAGASGGPDASAGIPDVPDPAGRLAAVICAKLGQLPSGAINVLVLASPGVRGATVGRAMGDLKRRAERREDHFFTRRGFASSRAFLAASRRLSAVLLPDGALWPNPEASRPLPAPVRTELQGEPRRDKRSGRATAGLRPGYTSPAAIIASRGFSATRSGRSTRARRRADS